ncbi:MAG: SDR family oxidoreductase [Aigarchaeota archaeon]|nr:SDR family oxidoreductase [Candidatus Pelearchaeum maunauluense]
MPLLDGRVCIVTGASGEIGSVVVEELVSEGAIVCAGARREDKLRELAERLSSDKIRVKKLDVSSSSSVDNFFNMVLGEFGRVDCLVNVAGYPMNRDLWFKPLHEVREEEVLAVMQVDFLGSLRCAIRAIPVMVKQRGGVVINISSTPAITGQSHGAAYTFAKAALISLTKHIAHEYAKHGVRAYTLALGNIKTKPTISVLSEEEFKAAAAEAPANRWGEPREVASVVSFLCSDKASFINGQTIIIDGGAVMR